MYLHPKTTPPPFLPSRPRDILPSPQRETFSFTRRDYRLDQDSLVRDRFRDQTENKDFVPSFLNRTPKPLDEENAAKAFIEMRKFRSFRARSVLLGQLEDFTAEPQMMSSVVKAMDRMTGGRLSATASTLDQVNLDYDTWSPQINTIIRGLSGIFEYLRATADWIMENKSIFFSVTLIALASFRWIRELTSNTLCWVFQGVRKLMGSLPTIVQDLVSFVCDRLAISTPKADPDGKETFSAQPQAYTDSAGPTSLIAVAMMAFLNRNGKKNITTAIKHASILAGGIATAASALSYLSTHFPDSLRNFLVDCKLIHPRMDMKRTFMNLVRDCSRCTKRAEEEPGCFLEVGFANTFLSNHAVLRGTWAKELQLCGTTSPEKIFVQDVLKRMEVHLPAARSQLSADRRVCPLGVYFSGPKGIGKTVLANACAIAAVPGVNASSRIWWWNPLSDYWVGFYEQKVIGFDDFGVSERTEEHIEELLRVISDNTYFPNMAFRKGVKASPKLVILTSNFKLADGGNGKTWTNPVTQGAFNRRFLNFEITLDPKFKDPKTGRLDTKTLPLDDPKAMCQFPHLRFREKRVISIDPHTKADVWGFAPGGVKTFQEILVILRAHIVQKEIEQEALIRTDQELVRTVDKVVAKEPVRVPGEAFDPFHHLIPQFPLPPEGFEVPDPNDDSLTIELTTDEQCVFSAEEVETEEEDSDDEFDEQKRDENGNEVNPGPEYCATPQMFAASGYTQEDPALDIEVPELVEQDSSDDEDDEFEWHTDDEYDESDSETTIVQEPAPPKTPMTIDDLKIFVQTRAELRQGRRSLIDFMMKNTREKMMEDPSYVPAKASCVDWISIIDPSALDIKSGRILHSLRTLMVGNDYVRAQAANSWIKNRMQFSSNRVRVLAAQYGLTAPVFVRKHWDLILNDVMKNGLYTDFDEDEDLTPYEAMSVSWMKHLSEDEQAALIASDPKEVVSRFMNSDVVLLNNGPDRPVTFVPTALADDHLDSKPWWSKAMSSMRDLLSGVPWKKVGLALGAVGALGGLVYALSGNTATPQGIPKYKKSKKLKQKKKPSRYTAQAQALMAGIEFEDSESEYRQVGRSIARIAKSVVELSISQNNRVANLNGFIVGDFLYTNRHFFLEPGTDKWVNEMTNIRMKTRSETYNFLFNPKSVLELSHEDTPKGFKRDLVKYRLPSVVQKPPSILKYFLSREDVDDVLATNFDFYFLISGDEYIPLEWGKLSSGKVSWTVGGKDKFSLRRYLTYPKMDNGTCGSMFVGVKNQKPHILSMHVAKRVSNLSRNEVSIGDIVTRDDFEGASEPEAFDAQPQCSTEILIKSVTEVEETSVELNPAYKMIGLPSIEPTKYRSGTVFTKSVVADSFPSTLEPSVQGGPRANGLTPIDIMKKEMNLAVGQDFKATEEEIDFSVEANKAHLLDSGFGKNGSARILSVSEAINGVPGTSVAPIDRSTSACFPLNSMGFKPGKKDFLIPVDPDEEMVEYEMSSTLEAEYFRVLYCLKSGQDPNIIFQGALKDELRSAKKIAALRTRVTQGGPLAHTILFRQFFGSLMDAIQSNFRSHPSAVGMDVYSSDWDQAMKYMSEVGSKGFDGDIKKFECYFKENVLRGLKDFVRWFYTTFDPNCDEEDHKIREALLDCTINPKLLVGKYVYQAFFLNPSGTAGTTIIFNNFLVVTMIASAYHRIMRRAGKHQFLTPHAYLQNVRAKVFGDDHIVAVSELIELLFNYTSMAKVMAEMGVVYTPADKEDKNPSPLKHLQDLQFLGNTSRFMDGSYEAVPDVDKLKEHLAWVKVKHQSMEQAVCTLMTDIQRMSFGAGREKFDELAAEFFVASRRANLNFVPLSHAGVAQMRLAKERRKGVGYLAGVDDVIDEVIPPYPSRLLTQRVVFNRTDPMAMDAHFAAFNYWNGRDFGPMLDPEAFE